MAGARLAVVLGCAVLAFAGSGCDALPGKPTAAERPLRPEQIIDFEVLYSRHCSGCHGADGWFGAARPLNDPLYLAWIDVETLRATIRDGVPDTAMPAFGVKAGGSLTDQQVEIVVGGIRSRWGRADEFDGFSFPAYRAAGGTGAADRGAGVYAVYCARCHGGDGHGGEHGGSVVDPSYLALVSDQALRTAVVAGRIDLGMPDWRGGESGAEMTLQQIADVIAWLSSHRTQFPGKRAP